jgi:hypothetical protein
MTFAIALSDEQWELVADLFDPPGRHGAPAVIRRHQMVDAMLFIARAGCQWRYLPERLRGVDRGLGPVAALARQRGLGDGDGSPDGDRPG